MKEILMAILILFIIGSVIDPVYAGTIVIGKNKGVIHISCDSDSMYPTFTCEDNLTIRYIRPSDRGNIDNGSIVIYAPTVEQRYIARKAGLWIKTVFVMHRIVNKVNGMYITQGDNNMYPDLDYGIIVKPYQISYLVTKINGRDVR